MSAVVKTLLLILLKLSDLFMRLATVNNTSAKSLDELIDPLHLTLHGSYCLPILTYASAAVSAVSVA